MKLNFWLNGVKREAEIAADTLLLDLLRSLGCYSVKRGCETANCGLCTVLMEERSVLSCSVLAVRAEGKHVTTLEGMQEKAAEFGAFLAGEGAEQCGFCNPGLIMNVFAMERELTDPTEEEIKEYLAGNLCRCSGFVGQTRGILKYLEKKKLETAETKAAEEGKTQESEMKAAQEGKTQESEMKAARERKTEEPESNAARSAKNKEQREGGPVQ